MAKTLTPNFQLRMYDQGDHPGAAALNQNWKDIDATMAEAAAGIAVLEEEVEALQGAAGDGTAALGILGAASFLTFSAEEDLPGSKRLIGTANQVIVTPSDGEVVLSLPQDIHTGASPTFAALHLGGPTRVLTHESVDDQIVMKRGTNPQIFKVYNYSEGIHNEWLNLGWQSNVAYVQSMHAGGTARDLVVGTSGASSLYLRTASTNRVQMNASGHLLWVTNNTLDIGGASNMPRDIRAGRDVYVGGHLTVGTATAITAENNRMTLRAIESMETLTDDDFAIFHTADAVNPLQLSLIFHGDPVVGKRYVGVQSAFLGDSYHVLCLNPAGGRVKACVPGEYFGVGLGQFEMPSASLHVADDGSGIKVTRGTVDYRAGFLSTSAAFFGTESAHPVVFRSGGGSRIRLETAGHLTWETHNSHDVGSGSAAPRDLYWGRQALASDGTASAPSYSFASDPDNGLYMVSGNTWALVSGGVERARISGSNWTFDASQVIRWGSSGIGSADLTLARDDANVLAQRNGVNAQSFRVYNTYTNAANMERVNLVWSGNVAYLVTEALGTGVARSLEIGTSVNAGLNFRTSSTSRWQVTGSGHLIGWLNNTYDIGASGANRPRTVYVGTSVVTPMLSVGAGPRASIGTIRLESGTLVNYRDSGDSKDFRGLAFDGDAGIVYVGTAPIGFIGGPDHSGVVIAGATQQLAFFRGYPVNQPSGFAVTNFVDRRSFSPTTVTLQQLAEVVGTLIGVLAGDNDATGGPVGLNLIGATVEEP
jgi:hypothetical protein